MATTAFETITEFLDWEDIKYDTTEMGRGTEVAFFGMRGDNQMGFLFMAEERSDTIQFRAIKLFSDEEKATLNDPDTKAKVMSYMLNKNAEYKLGKWTLDDENDIYFALSQYWDMDDKIDKALLKRTKSILFDSVDEMVTEIKQIMNGSTPVKKESEPNVDQLLKMLGA
jgi:hypothetical protein